MSDVTALLINTRGHPESLVATCMSLMTLSKRPYDLRFCIRVDQDDLPTFDAIRRLQNHMSVTYTIGGRPKSLGANLNLFCKIVPAGFYHVINDDVLPLTPNWDEPQLRRRDKQPAFVSCWTLPEAGVGSATPDYPIVTRAWLDAAGGDIFTNYFPYWFDDRWLQEVAMYVFGKDIKPLDISLSARKNRTQRMRDIDFWFGFFIDMLDERIEQAQSICDKLGIKCDVRRDRAKVISFMTDLQRKDRVRIPESHGAFADPGEPDPAYLAAKREAEHILEAVRGKSADKAAA